MPDSSNTPTPDPDVNAVLGMLLSEARAVLGSRFVGLYLYGSLAGGDFNPHTSDVDFLVVTLGELPQETIEALQAMHARIDARGLKWAAKLEGAYLPLHVIRRHEAESIPCPTLNEGRFYLDRPGSDWVLQRHLLREHGMVVAGPAPRTLIDPVRPDALRRAVLEVLEGWWAPMLHEPHRLSAPGYPAFAVLTMCRVLHTLRHGTLVSKPAAARWAVTPAGPGERWRPAVEWALAWRPGDPPAPLEAILALIRDTVERSRRFREPGP